MESFNNKQFLFFVFIFFLNTLVSCSDEIPKINRITSKEDLPTVAIDEFKTTLTENGKVTGKMKAKRLEQFNKVVEPHMKFPKGISVVTYDNTGVTKSSMTANYFVYYNKKETWEAVGNVVFSNINGDILMTDHLYGDEKENKIYTDEYVEIKNANGNIIRSNSGFESNSSFTIYKFVDVSGQIMVQEEFASETDTIK
ncbi:MAG: LPS export ABC transporter periplasmic protein LptC [Bacteroidetes bacterium 4572_117]|nr:MAG: LPS export ABC transporter periplasmic protein LptC [Bacteroidetes bacterium 4572_117]